MQRPVSLTTEFRLRVEVIGAVEVDVFVLCGCGWPAASSVNE
jgi:hypothetical protein